MAFAKPLVLDYNGSATKSLPLVSQDGYNTEYYLRGTTDEFRVKIRHATENKKADGTVMQRHNVEMTRTIFGVGDNPDTVQQVYLVVRNSSRDSAVEIGYLGKALSLLMVEARYSDLVGLLS